MFGFYIRFLVSAQPLQALASTNHLHTWLILIQVATWPVLNSWAMRLTWTNPAANISPIGTEIRSISWDPNLLPSLQRKWMWICTRVEVSTLLDLLFTTLTCIRWRPGPRSVTFKPLKTSVRSLSRPLKSRTSSTHHARIQDQDLMINLKWR